MVDGGGIEPPSHRLEVGCSPNELPAHFTEGRLDACRQGRPSPLIITPLSAIDKGVIRLKQPCYKTYVLPLHRACAAFFAISLRCSGVSFRALASPPFLPPNRPRATAAGFFSRSDRDDAFSPVASWTMLAARRLMSLGFLCFVMA